MPYPFIDQVIKLDGILSNVQNAEIQTYSSTSITALSDVYGDQIRSTEVFGTPWVHESWKQTLQLDGTLYQVQDTQLQTYSTTSINELNNALSSTIALNTSFGLLEVAYKQIEPAEILSTLIFGSPKLNTTIYAQSIESTISYGEDALKLYVTPNTVSSTLLFGDAQINSKIYSNSVSSTLEIGGISVNQILYAQSIESTIGFGDGNKFSLYILDQPIVSELQFGTHKLNSTIYSNSVESTIGFGDDRLNFRNRITDIPISSTLQFGTAQLNQKLYSGTITSGIQVSSPNVLKVIGPLSIATTANFGTATFIDNIHRMLVFKNDNISKIGDNDAGVVAGGIRINPSTAIAENAIAGDFTLPNKAAGFVSVNIAGKDYLMPYFNA